MSSHVNEQLLSIYHKLYNFFGPQHWWPGETPFEVCVGAILTQNTSWINVNRAISNLRANGLLTPKALYNLPRTALAEIIRPAGYYNIKAERLHQFVSFLVKEHEGETGKMFETGLEHLRKRLLAIKGIGPETADSILLYAGKLPTFVVDAYTRRVLIRHDLIPDDAGYEDIRSFFMDNLPPEVPFYNEYHALLIAVGKRYCRNRNPVCDECPLNGV